MQIGRHASLLRLGCSAIWGLAMWASVPAFAQADASVVVLGITSVEGDDDFARNLTGAIRHAAGSVEGWQVSSREVTLSQMVLAHGCEDVPDPACLEQIAGTLSAQKLVFGILRRSTGTGRPSFELSLSVYDAGTQRIERTFTETLPRSRSDIDDLRDPARRAMVGLTGPQTGSLRIVTNTPGATVRIDGSAAGTADREGIFEQAEIAVGDHDVEISAPERATWTASVTIAASAQMTLDAPLTDAAAGGGGGGGGGDELLWAGVGLIAAGAAVFGGAIYAWVRYLTAWNDYYGPYRAATPDGQDVCRSARMGEVHGDGGVERARSVAGFCDEWETLNTLQWVFSGIGGALAATGAVLIVLHATNQSGGSSSESPPPVTLIPSFGPDGGSLTLHGQF